MGQKRLMHTCVGQKFQDKNARCRRPGSNPEHQKILSDTWWARRHDDHEANVAIHKSPNSCLVPLWSPGPQGDRQAEKDIEL